MLRTCTSSFWCCESLAVRLHKELRYNSEFLGIWGIGLQDFNFLSIISRSINHIAGTIILRYKNTDGQNHFHSWFSFIVSVKIPSKISNKIGQLSHQKYEFPLKFVTCQITKRLCKANTKRVIVAVMIAKNFVIADNYSSSWFARISQ